MTKCLKEDEFQASIMHLRPDEKHKQLLRREYHEEVSKKLTKKIPNKPLNLEQARSRMADQRAKGLHINGYPPDKE